MDYFESLCKTLLEDDGYWVRQSYKIDLSKEQKKQLGKPSLPRPEIDLLAFNHRKNELLFIEVKSFLDSHGVRLQDLKEEHKFPEGKYKVVTCQMYRTIIESQLKHQLTEEGLVSPKTKTRFGLIFGKVRPVDDQGIQSFCHEKDWFYWSPDEVRARVTNLAQKGYENEPSVITAKILLR